MRITAFTILGSLLCSSFLLGQNVTGVANPAAVTQSNAVAPGSLVSIFGGSLSGSLASADSVALSTSLGDVTAVSINGTASPLVMVSDGAITAQMPWEVIAGPATVSVARGAALSNTFNMQVNQFAPAFFNIRLGGLQAIAVNGDGSLAAPAGILGTLNAHPATAGDTVTFYATGLGPVNSGLANGALPKDGAATTVNQPVVTIGGMAAQVSYSGMSSQSFGVYQVSVVVPTGVTPGKFVPVQLQIGGATTTDPVTIAVQ
jgi:uncharacterized protein (TIGR03437 family)